jgi:hypothetical protein
LDPLVLERFCERVLAEIEQVTENHTQSAHQQYLDIRGGLEFSDRGISGFLAGHDRRNEIHEEAET